MSSAPDLFTTRMRKATRKIHNVSDTLVNAKFAIALRDEQVWGRSLFVFYHVFAYLEDARERLNNEDFNSLFVHKILFRKKAFEEDLRHYLGEEFSSLPKNAALENYLEHLQELERDNPTLLMAYVYHLYLGLLSGGQILSKKRKMFGDKNAAAAYQDKLTDFTEIDIGQLKTEFRTAMNKIADKMTAEQQDAFIEESNQVFLMNNLIVNSVEGQNQVIYNMLMKATAVVAVVLGVLVTYKMHK